MSSQNVIDLDILTDPDPPKDIDLLDTLQLRRIPLYEGMGFVEIIDMMPRRVPAGRTADIAISRNARVSYAQGDKSIGEDSGLVRYLMEHYHTSPSESVEFQFRIRLPIFVERQLVRHRTASINEQSFRYIVPTDQFYYPHLRMQSQNNKQGSSDAEVPPQAQKLWDEVATATHEMYTKYEALIAQGVAREVARCCLPVSLMTELMWKMDLHNLLGFLQLRITAHAQKEIRDLANAIYQLITPLVPISVTAFQDFRLNSIMFTVEEQLHAQGNIELEGRKKNNIVGKLRKLGLTQ